ncbi:hypothetical protein ABIC65_001100 [Sphingomonas trueperi]|uniref:hypothetical protein n=1 Tax=Sphingomonas trueperi TaxID=53317 RepID=UPI003392192C
MLPIFPAHVFCPETVSAAVVPDVISGGTSLVGEQDIIEADGGGRWQISYGGIALDTPYQQRLWKAWAAKLSGGSVPVLVPLLSVATGPRPIAGNGFAAPSDLYVNDDYFPTEVRFASPHIIATITAPVALRATTMQIAVSQGGQVQPGMDFGVGVHAQTVEEVLSRSGLSATVKVSPPSRMAISAGTAANFDWPCVVCRLAPGQNLAAAITNGLYGDVEIQFVEDTAYAA